MASGKDNNSTGSAMKKTFAKEELRKWTVPQLSGYLKNRGVVISAHAERIYAKQLGLQVLPSEVLPSGSSSSSKRIGLTETGAICCS